MVLLNGEAVVELIRSRVLALLGDEVVGIYLFGSLATGDFDPGVSDVDLLVVTAADLTTETFSALQHLHEGLVDADPGFRDRIEVIYLGAAALRDFQTVRSPLTVISPGEPLHSVEAGREWLVNWYNVRQHGRSLYGPPAAEVVPVMTVEELRAELREQLAGWPGRIRSNRAPGFLAYAILTVCRAWHTIADGTVYSKARSASWVAAQVPEWAGLIDAAVAVRLRGPGGGFIDPVVVAGFIDEVAGVGRLR